MEGHRKRKNQRRGVLSPGTERIRALIGLDEAERARPELEALLQQYPRMDDARDTLANLYLGEKQYAKPSDEFNRMWSSTPPDNRGILELQSVKLGKERRGGGAHASRLR